MYLRALLCIFRFLADECDKVGECVMSILGVLGRAVLLRLVTLLVVAGRGQGRHTTVLGRQTCWHNHTRHHRAANHLQDNQNRVLGPKVSKSEQYFNVLAVCNGNNNTAPNALWKKTYYIINWSWLQIPTLFWYWYMYRCKMLRDCYVC